MGFASHLGPWRLGTVKDTTGTTAGTISNMGCTTVAQSAAIAYTTTTAATVAVLPAGSQITNIFVDVTTAFNSGTNNVITIQTAGGSSLATVTATAANITFNPGGPGYSGNIGDQGTLDIYIPFTNPLAFGDNGFSNVYFIFAVQIPSGRATGAYQFLPYVEYY